MSSDNETLPARVARLFPKAPKETQETMVTRLRNDYWGGTHFAYEDSNGIWREALGKAADGLDMGAKAPPTAEQQAADLEAEARANVEKTIGKRFSDIMPAETRLAYLAQAKQIILDRRGGQITAAERIAGEIETRAAVRANYDAEQQAYSARTGEPLAPSVSIIRQRALEDAHDHLRLANALPPPVWAKASPIQKALRSLAAIRANAKAGKYASDPNPMLAHNLENSALQTIRSLSPSTYDKVRFG